MFEVTRLLSKDENVKKFIFKKEDAIAEAVLYKYPTYKDRTVICCSVQSGCAVGCTFCGTGKNFIRNLSVEEILQQIGECIKEVRHTEGTQYNEIKKLQIMFMSMGEPLHNYNKVSEAIVKLSRIFPNADLLVSTSAPSNGGMALADLILLSRRIPKIGLQFSVHESTDEARSKLIPTRTMTLEQIGEYGYDFYTITKRRPFFNYCVHEKNSTLLDAINLSKVLDPSIWECTLSVICNADETIQESKERQLVTEFSTLMLNVGYSIRIFNPAGQDDIGGGCGQLWATQEFFKKHKK